MVGVGGAINGLRVEVEIVFISLSQGLPGEQVGQEYLKGIAKPVGIVTSSADVKEGIRLLRHPPACFGDADIVKVTHGRGRAGGETAVEHDNGVGGEV